MGNKQSKHIKRKIGRPNKTKRNRKTKKNIKGGNNENNDSLVNELPTINKDTKNNNSDLIGGKNKKKIIIGKIYADWCGHCKSLKPEWKKMKEMIKLNTGRTLKNVEFKFYEMGETAENDMYNISLQQQINDFNAEHFPNGDKKIEVDGYPTLFKICRNKIEYYNGVRMANDLYNWYTKKC